MKAQKFITTLSTADKIKLYNALYEDLSGKGIEGDTELAHVNKEEMAVLLAMGGSGTINPNTGLVQFSGGGGSSSGSQTTQQEFPEEMKPYISDILGRSKAIYEQRADEGFQPYTGPRIAEFDPSQQAAMAGIEGMVGGAEPAYQAGFGQLGQAAQSMGGGQALTGAGAATVGTGLGYIDPGAQAIQSGLAGIMGGQRRLGQAYGMARRGEQGLMAGEQMLSPAASLAASSAGDVRGDIGSYMSPYMRQVIDVQKREAQRASDIAGQQQAAQAVQAGAFGGSRQAILEAERERNLAQQLGDIEATGMQAAYQDAARMAEAQKARELQASGQFGQLAGQAGQLGLGRGQLAGTLGQLSATQGSLGTQAGGLGSQLAGLSSLTTGAGQALGQLGTGAANIGAQQAGLGMQYGQLGSQQQGQLAQDYQNLMNIGAMRQGQTQTALDQAYQQFQQEQEFPMQSLQDYSSIIRGYYKDPTTYKVMTPPTPSTLSQIAGLGAAGLGAYGAFGGFRKTGGKVDPQRGLGSIVVKRSAGEKIGKPMFPINPVTFQGALGAGVPTYPDPNLYKEETETKRKAYEAMAAARKKGLTQDEDTLSLIKRLREKDFSKRKEDLAAEREQDKESIEQNKYLALMNLGLSTMGQTGNLLSAVSKGAKESNFTEQLMSLAREDRKQAKEYRKDLLSIDDAEVENLAALSKISKDQQRAILDAELKKATDTIAQADDAIANKKDFISREKDARGESREVAELLHKYNKEESDARVALAKLNKPEDMGASDYLALKRSVGTRLHVLVDDYGNFTQKNKQPLEESQAREALELLSEATKIWGETARAEGGSKAKGFEIATRYIMERPTAGKQSSKETAKPVIIRKDGVVYRLRSDGSYVDSDGNILKQ